MFDDKIFIVLVILTGVLLLVILGILVLSFIAYLDIAFGFSFVNGEALLRAINGQ